ncbi:IS1380 family transposase, partial [Nesterenkonia salmonea]
MLFNHAPAAVSYTFDEPNLVSVAGLVPVMAFAQSTGLAGLAEEKITVRNTGADKGANPEAKISSLVAGMVAGADSIDDVDLLRHGGMGSLFEKVYAPSTLGSHLRAYTHGHVKQLAAVSSSFLASLGAKTPLLPVPTTAEGKKTGAVFVDIDDTVIEVFSPKKQGAGYGYNKTRGLNALLVTATTTESSPVIIGQQLRKGAAHSARGADKTLADALSTLKRVPGRGAPVVVRADSAYYGAKIAAAALRAGADLSVTVRLDQKIKKTIATVEDQAWQKIEYKDAIFDEATGTSLCAWIRRSRRPSPPLRTRRGRRSSTRTRSSMRPPAPGSLRPRSLKSRSPPSHRRVKTSRSLVGSSCVGY